MQQSELLASYAVFHTRRVLACLILGLFSTFPHAKEIKLASTNTHAQIWNAFVKNVFSLHQRQIVNQDIEIRSKTGGYDRNPNFYIEKTYIDRKSGLTLSRIRWERENPENIHVIEVFVHNPVGRVERDYSAAYLPIYRKAPSQTLISHHHYIEKLHAFRSFDASGNLIFERCQGESDNGKRVDIMLDEDAMDAAQGEKNGIFFTPVYKKCFSSMQKTIEIDKEFP